MIPILTGPTATGKSSFALELARERPEFEIVNADSLLVYRAMDIGTAKPSREELREIRHHLIDVRDPDETYTAGDFVREVEAALADIASRGRLALIVGGTGFYLKALLFGLWDSPKADPALRAELEKRSNPDLYAELEKLDAPAAYRIGLSDRYRLLRALEIHGLSGKTPSQLERESEARGPDPRFRVSVLDRADEELRERIAQRTRAMLEAGLLTEVDALRARWPGVRALSSVGYAEACRHLDGLKPPGRKLKPGLEGLQEEIELATRQLVKKQRTWFRGMMPRLGAGARWFRLDDELPELRKELARL